MAQLEPVLTPPQAWHAHTEAEALARLNSVEHGLASAEAERRLAEGGCNELAAQAVTPAWRVFLQQFQSPLIYVLLAAAGISFFVGKRFDPYVILGVVGVNAVIGFCQEHHPARALDALKQLTNPRVTVLRGGLPVVLDARMLVPGDVLVLEAGDRVGADARVLSASELVLDESALTGESMPVRKQSRSRR